MGERDEVIEWDDRIARDDGIEWTERIEPAKLTEGDRLTTEPPAKTGAGGASTGKNSSVCARFFREIRKNTPIISPPLTTKIVTKHATPQKSKKPPEPEKNCVKNTLQQHVNLRCVC